MTHEEAIEKFGKPLTLEQLQEMYRKPVWIEYKEGAPPNQWKIVKFCEENKIVAFTDDRYELVGLYGYNWLAYAYPPANIDRKAWEPCECCRSAKFMNGQSMYNFCQNCGRPLTDEAWEKLEKRLRGVQLV